jgi:hypothetical protein
MIPMLRAFLLALLLTAGFLPASARAEAVISSLTRSDLRKIMAAEGYSAVDHEEHANAILWKTEGYRASIFVEKSGTSLQFYAVFKATETSSLGKVNQWNRSKRYSRSYIDKDGDPVLELDLDLAGGITRARIIDFLKTCQGSFVVWRQEVLR